MANLKEFKQDWFNHPEWWFSQEPSYDSYITTKYEDLLSTVQEDTDPLTAIIIYDQLPRHIFRGQQAEHIIAYYLDKALNIVRKSLHTQYEQTLTPQEWTFFMLPFRHTKHRNKILYVIKCTWQRLSTDNNPIYKRFLKATYTRFLRDHPSQLSLMYIYGNINCPQVQDPTKFSDLLAYCPNTYRSPIESPLFISSLGTDLPNIIKSNIDPSQPIIISLSGGVDSMVCSFILKHTLQKTNTKLMALHINYDNRPQCDQEVAFLRQWCSHLQIPLYIRAIKEIHRAPCMQYELRDLYESYTRDVRYQSYKSLIEPTASTSPPQVILGHNEDDCLENIMTNIAHQNKYDNLMGMTFSSEQDGINFIRPLLKTSKENIIQFAKDNNIPFLPNSTPTWSQRGQIRNNIVPVLDKWDTRFVPALFELSKKMSGLHDVLRSSVSQFITRNTSTDPNNFNIQSMPFTDLVTIDVFWHEFFVSYFTQRPSSKSIHNLIEAINNFKEKEARQGDKRKVMVARNISFELTMLHNKQVQLRAFKI